MSAYFKVAFVFAMLTLVGCGTSQSSSAPSPKDPTPPSTDLGNTGGTSGGNTSEFDRRLPYTTVLFNWNNAGLQAMIPAGEIFQAPIVGDVRVAAVFKNTNTTDTNSEFWIAFEDQRRLMGMLMYSVPMAAVRDSQNTAWDFSYGHSYLSVRVLATRVGQTSQFQGGIYYRVRQSGETQCNVRYTCPAQPATALNVNSSASVQEWNNYNSCQNLVYIEAQACRSYLDPAQTSSVKLLGTFTVDESKWAVLN